MATCSFVVLFVLMPVILGAWKLPEDRTATRLSRRGLHYHSKRHMLPEKLDEKKRPPTSKTRDLRKKPSGHLTPLQDDDMDNDAVVSVAIGPPSVRPKYEKNGWKNQSSRRNSSKTSNHSNYNDNAVSFVKDVLTQLGREFLLNQVNENFVFGQYVGNAMKNFTDDVRLRMQHDILDLIVKYQRINLSDNKNTKVTSTTEASVPKPKEEYKDTLVKETKSDSKSSVSPSNDTEEGWPDFSNLAKIVG